MKKLLTMIFIFLILIILINNEETLMVPEESIRFRVIANSNETNDIKVKEYLTNKLLSNKEIFNVDNIDDSRKTINNNIKKLDKVINNTFQELNYNKDYKINYGMNYFPEKTYKGIKYDSGYYESLVITIGEGKGNNYWCVMYPPLCMIDENVDEYEYRFKIKEIIDRYVIKK